MQIFRHLGGLIGSKLLSILLEQPEYKKVVVLVRQPLGIANFKLEEKVIDFNRRHCS